MKAKPRLPETVKTKTFLSTILILSLISGLLIFRFVSIAAYVGQEQEPWLTLPLQDATYIVGRYNSTFYYARNFTGHGVSPEGYEWLNTNPATVVNNAINALTHQYPEKIVFIGQFSFSSPIQLQNYTVLDFYNAKLQLTAHCNLIETVNDNNVHSIEIYGGLLEGNNYTGDAVHLNVTQDLIPSWRSKIEGLTINNFWGDGIALIGTGGRAIVSNNYIYSCKRGIYANSPDNELVANVIGDSEYQGICISGGTNHIVGGKSYGSGKTDAASGRGIDFYGGHGIHVTALVLQENYADGAYIPSGSYAIQMVGCTYDRNSLGSSGTYDGCCIAGDNVTITGGIVKNMEGKSKTQNHGVRVKSTAEHIKIVGLEEHEILGDKVYTEAGATDVWVDEEQIGGDGAPVGNSTALPYMFMVWRNSTSTYLIEGETANILDNADNYVTVFEWAFGNLTSGRSWKEKVVIQGDYPKCNDTINLESWLELEIQGFIGLNDAQNQNLFSTSSKNHIEIHGGVIDPNGDGQSSTTHGLLFTSCSDISIHHCIIYGGYGTVGSGDSIRFADCTYSSVHDNYFEKYSVSYDDVKIRGTSSQYNIVCNNVFNATSAGYSAPVQISNGANRNEVTSNLMFIDGGSASAIKLHDADDNLIADNKIYMYTDVYGCIDIIEDGERNFITGNQIYGAEHGIWFRETSTNAPQWNKITNNHIVLRDWDGATGIELDDNDNTLVHSNIIICSGTTGTQTGINVESDCTDTLLDINYFDTDLDNTVSNAAGSETYIVNGTVTGGYDIDFP